jgi:hypothetical protein
VSKIRKGDQVVVLSGRDKGRQGQVLEVFADGRVLVENVNKVKKHQKPNPQGGSPGGIVEKESAARGLEGRDLEHGPRSGPTRRLQDARGRQEGALLQVERRGCSTHNAFGTRRDRYMAARHSKRFPERHSFRSSKDGS